MDRDTALDQGYYLGLYNNEVIDMDKDDDAMIQRIYEERGREFIESGDFVVLMPGSGCPCCHPEKVERGEL